MRTNLQNNENKFKVFFIKEGQLDNTCLHYQFLGLKLSQCDIPKIILKPKIFPNNNKIIRISIYDLNNINKNNDSNLKIMSRNVPI